MLCHLKRILWLAAGMILAAAPATAAFSDDLSPQERVSSGLSSLSPKEVSALDRLVAQDADLARQGGVTGFGVAFTERRTKKETAEAGLGRLSTAQQGQLNALVAFSIANPQPEIPHFRPRPVRPVQSQPTTAAVPVSVALSVPRVEIHGELSFMIGGGKGGSFYGGALDLSVTDPSRNFSATIGISELRGKGFAFPYLALPPWYPPGSPYFQPVFWPCTPW